MEIKDQAIIGQDLLESHKKFHTRGENLHVLSEPCVFLIDRFAEMVISCQSSFIRFGSS